MRRWKPRPAAGLLSVAAGVLALLVIVINTDWPLLRHAIGVFALAVFSIYCGYQRLGASRISLERLGQAVAILTIGPVLAIPIAASAAFISPWLLARRPGRDRLRLAVQRALIAGLLTLLGGLVYAWFRVGPPSEGQIFVYPGALIALTVTLMFAESLLRMLLARQRPAWAELDIHSILVDAFAVIVAILLVVIWAAGSVEILSLFVIVCVASMLQFRNLGTMKSDLEDIVDSRTQHLQEQSEMLEIMTRTDDLTGLHNRRHAQAWLEQAVREAQARGLPLSVAIVDLDDFKGINDEHSHMVGDAVLKRVAKVLQAGCQEGDLVARLGGEEFILCFPGQDQHAAAQICEGMRRTIAQLDLSDIAQGLALTASFGVALVNDGDAGNLLQRADRAQYAAKAGGKNCVSIGHAGVFSPIGG